MHPDSDWAHYFILFCPPEVLTISTSFAFLQICFKNSLILGLLWVGVDTEIFSDDVKLLIKQISKLEKLIMIENSIILNEQLKVIINFSLLILLLHIFMIKNDTTNYWTILQPILGKDNQK